MTGRELLGRIANMKNLDNKLEFKEFVEVDENTRHAIETEAKKSNQTPEEYLKALMQEVTEIVPTKEERKLWKGYLYESCRLLATERYDCAPRKRDSLNDLLDTFFYWADTYNEGYFSEKDEADSDRYCAWLVQQHDRRNAAN